MDVVTTQEDVPEEASINRVIGPSEVHLPHKTGGAIPTPCFATISFASMILFAICQFRIKADWNGLINDGSTSQS